MEGSSVVYMPTTENKPPRNTSFMFLSENNFSLLKPNNKTGLLRGPRRVLRLCVFVLVLPSVLVTIPLYVRLVLYPPGHYSMMPTDQRLLNGHVSSIWCQAQSTHMNGSFNAYLSPDVPHISDARRSHVMLQNLQLEDDVKEYWGFYFLKGTTVTLSACARWDGGQLMVLRGVENLHRCAWIGEKDSAEDMEEDDDAISEENIITLMQEKSPDDLNRDPDSSGIPKTRIATKKYDKTEDAENKEDSAQEVITEDSNVREIGTEDDDDNVEDIIEGLEGPAVPSLASVNSEERRRGLTELLREAIRLSKGKKEILKILHKEGKDPSSNAKASRIKSSNSNPKNNKKPASVSVVDIEPDVDGSKNVGESLQETSKRLKLETTSGKRRRDGDKKRRLKKKGNRRDENLTEEELPEETRYARLKRSLQKEEADGAFEDDADEGLAVLNEPRQKNSSVDDLLGAQIFFSEGLKFERGLLNQTTANDNSREEHRSSYSSSEEALASCEGVILTLPLLPYKSCSYRNVGLNKIVYDIPITGTYYFVFSSDNEIYTNDLFFNLTMDRVVYEVGEREQFCGNSTDCSLPLNFWSNEQVVVEVPQEPDWNQAYLLDTKCEPRVYVYLVLILFVPLLIMCCAFH